MAAAVAYQVYILQNQTSKFYIGLSVDVAVRLHQHNSGVSQWTRHRGPWTLVWVSQLLSLSEARRMENFLKRQKGGDGFYAATGLKRSSGS